MFAVQPISGMPRFGLKQSKPIRWPESPEEWALYKQYYPDAERIWGRRRNQSVRDELESSLPITLAKCVAKVFHGETSVLDVAHYIHRALKNATVNVFRRQQRAQSMERMSEDIDAFRNIKPPSQLAPENNPLETLARVQGLIEQLPPKKRRTLETIFDIQRQLIAEPETPLPVQETLAKRLGVTLNQAKMQLFHARNALEKLMRKSGLGDLLPPRPPLKSLLTEAAPQQMTGVLMPAAEEPVVKPKRYYRPALARTHRDRHHKTASRFHTSK